MQQRRAAADGFASMRVPVVVSEIRKIAKSPEFRSGLSERAIDGVDRFVSRDEVFPVWEGFLRCFTVFNTLQIDGLPSAMAEPPASVPVWSGDEAAEQLIDSSGGVTGGSARRTQGAAATFDLPL
jgi:hypothetical protein